MTLDTAKTSRKLLDERDELKDFLEVCSNYDSHMYAVVGSLHNNNRKVYVERKIEVSADLKNTIKEFATKKIEEIDTKLEAL